MRKNKGRSKSGTLILIGGREEKTGAALILSKVAEHVGSGNLVIATVASAQGISIWQEYRRAFKRLGVKHIRHLDVVHRKKSGRDNSMEVLKGANAVFFTGGDQFKITSELSGTPAGEEIQKIYEKGGLIAGTSAGASVMSDVMFVGASSARSFRIDSLQHMAPGLGLVNGLIIDQHFVERGRIGRLIGAVSKNPKFLGIGLDEDTAIVMRSRQKFQVIGRGAVVVIDAHDATESNVSEKSTPVHCLSIFNIRFHVLAAGDRFDLRRKVPIKGRGGSGV